MNTEQLLNCGIKAATNGATGYLLGANPLPYAAAAGFEAVTFTIGWNIFAKTKISNENLHKCCNLGGLALTSVVMATLGVTNPTNVLLATAALVVNVAASFQKREWVNDPVNKVRYTVLPIPIVLLQGASQGVLEACAFGWNPIAFGTIYAVRHLVWNTNYKIFGCLDGMIDPKGARIVKNLTGNLFAISLLNKDLVGVAASVAFAALCWRQTQAKLAS